MSVCFVIPNSIIILQDVWKQYLYTSRFEYYVYVTDSYWVNPTMIVDIATMKPHQSNSDI